MNTFALAEDKEWGALSGTATRCIICVEVSLRSFFTAAEVELLVAGLRYTLLQAMLFCLRGYFQLRNTLRQVPRQVAESGGYEILSVGAPGAGCCQHLTTCEPRKEGSYLVA